jgi:hypothetical protein
LTLEQHELDAFVALTRYGFDQQTARKLIRATLASSKAFGTDPTKALQGVCDWVIRDQISIEATREFLEGMR